MELNSKIDYLEKKRIRVLETIKPICEAFNITKYDYTLDELLIIEDTQIGCMSNSICAIVDELIGYIFVNIYCGHRCLGAFEKQTLNVIKRYWINK